MNERYYFIINPMSGSHLDVTGLKKLCQWLKEQGKYVRVDLTESMEHVGQLTSRAIAENATTVIAAGGDGTIRTVIDAMAGSEIPILIVPSGTENLLAGEVGLDGSIETTANTLLNGKIQKIDLGNANNIHFMAITGVGFDAEVVKRVHYNRRGHITHTNYIRPLVQTFLEHKFPYLTVEIDGEIVCNEPAMAFVSNISRYAVGLGIAKEAKMGDGFLDVTIFKCRGKRQLAKHAINTVLNRDGVNTIRQKCKKVIISSPQENVYTQIDGDPGPQLPLKIEVIPAAARLLVPPGDMTPVRYYHLKKWFLR
ncbi:MAG: NAD(+)/NADH kinase [Phycisphaerae bacterium]|nr:NAD(+)/NADH kinase [Phycisphaerae bacterium]